MKKRKHMRTVSAAMTAVLSISWAGVPAFAENETEEENTGLVGTLAFAKCDDYINIRKEASTCR